MTEIDQTAVEYVTLVVTSRGAESIDRAFGPEGSIYWAAPARRGHSLADYVTEDSLIDVATGLLRIEFCAYVDSTVGWVDVDTLKTWQDIDALFTALQIDERVPTLVAATRLATLGGLGNDENTNFRASVLHLDRILQFHREGSRRVDLVTALFQSGWYLRPLQRDMAIFTRAVNDRRSAGSGGVTAGIDAVLTSRGVRGSANAFDERARGDKTEARDVVPAVLGPRGIDTTVPPIFPDPLVGDADARLYQDAYYAAYEEGSESFEHAAALMVFASVAGIESVFKSRGVTVAASRIDHEIISEFVLHGGDDYRDRIVAGLTTVLAAQPTPLKR